MSRPHHSAEENGESDIRDTAARWVVRHDRKLSEAETFEFEAWLAADARHASAFERAESSWCQFRQIGAAVRHAERESPVRRARRNWTVAAGLAAAAAVVLFNMSWRVKGPNAGNQVATSVDATAPIVRSLNDGSTARLRAGAEMVEKFSAGERRVLLVRGEIFFDVVKDKTRPFLVQVGEATVRAVGTAFSVTAQPDAVNVLVTEGAVQVTAPVASSKEPLRASERVAAGHRAVVARNTATHAPSITVTTVSPPEIARELAWCGQMLDLGGATLAELAAAFGERSGRRIVVDPSLAKIRIGGQFPTDDFDGFIRAIEEAYGIKAERQSDSSVTLRAR